MRSARLYNDSKTTAYPPAVMNEYVSEALARQAARRPPKGPPKEMPTTPTLPRVPKPHGRRRRSGK